MQVKFADLGIDNPIIVEAVGDVLRSGRFIGGPWVDEFAKEWAAYCGAQYCTTVASGSAALTVALKAIRHIMDLDVDAGLVIVPALSFVATAFSVVEAGFTPLYVDVTPDGLLDLDQAAEAAADYHSVIGAVLVHLYGQWLNTGELPSELVGLDFILEDAAQAHGVCRHASMSISAAIYSFYPSKNLGAAGDAGAIVTNSRGLSRCAHMFANYGDPPGQKYVHRLMGGNERMDAIQAAVLLSKLRSGQLDEDNDDRAGCAGIYARLGVRSIATTLPNSWHLYPILADQPDILVKALAAGGVESGRYYPYTLPEVAAGMVYRAIPNAECMAAQVVSLPIGPHLDIDKLSHVVDALGNIAELQDDIWVVKEGVV